MQFLAHLKLEFSCILFIFWPIYEAQATELFHVLVVLNTYLWLTCELTKRKCICKKVNKAWRIGWAIRMFSTQFFSIVACIAISNPVKIRVPRPKTAKKIWISTILYIKPFLVRLAKVQIHSSTSSFYTYFRFISLVQFWSILVCVRCKRSHFCVFLINLSILSDLLLFTSKSIHIWCFFNYFPVKIKVRRSKTAKI